MKLKIGDQVEILSNIPYGKYINNLDDVGKRALIIGVCSKLWSYRLNKYKQLYKILFLPANNMDYTWWLEENDLKLTS